MPERRQRELLEAYFLEEMQKARRAWKHGLAPMERYEEALGHFNRFVIKGEFPAGFDPESVLDPAKVRKAEA